MPASLIGIANGAIAIFVRLPLHPTVTHTFASFTVRSNDLFCANPATTRGRNPPKTKTSVQSSIIQQNHLLWYPPRNRLWPHIRTSFGGPSRMSTYPPSLSVLAPKAINWSIALSILLILAGLFAVLIPPFSGLAVTL